MAVDGSRGPGEASLRQLSLDLAAIAVALFQLAKLEEVRSDTAPGGPVTARQIETLIAARQARAEAFGLDVVHPAWSILLQLYLAHIEEQPIRVGELRTRARLAAATAARWLDRICAAGLATRKTRRKGARPAVVALTPAGAAAMRDHLHAIKAGWIIA
jgi:DNA-binding MarR family transcriptional regulator